jgi:iron complex outermembrane receptor protein
VVRGNFCGDGTVCSANGDISGNALQRTSDLQWNVGIAGEDAMTDTLDYFWRADVMGQSEQFVSEINVATIEPRTLVNLRLGLRGENWSASIYAKNLFDEEYVSNAFYIAAPFFGTYVPALGNQRRVGATFSYDY